MIDMRRRSEAFTMMEIMVVIFIIGMLAATLGPRIQRYRAQGAATQIKLKLNNIKDALTEYSMAVGEFPSGREGLRALLENPRPNDPRYSRVPKNNWPFLTGGEDALMDAGIPFEYNRPPEKNKAYKIYEVIYPGPTGGDDDPLKQDAGV